jgi:molybdopterin-synthase adenylyltransferase
MATSQDRYARHHLIPGFSQDLVASLNVGVVGAGAIGNEVVKNLLLTGVGRIDVYDFDTAELSNLTRSVFLRESDIGSNKAHALVNRAMELNPSSVLRAFAGPIDRTLSLTQCSQYDMVIAAVDNIEARLRINDMALLTCTPWINAAIDSRSVVVELFPNNRNDHKNNPKKDQTPSSKPLACYACNLPDAAFEREARRLSCGGLQRAAYLTRTVPTTAITASSAGALVCSELLRYVHNADLLGKYTTDIAQRVFFDTATPSVTRTYLSRALDERGCPGCGLHQALTLVDGINRQAIQQTQTVRLSDPIIVACHCTRCGASAANTASLTTLVGSRAREKTDAILRCPQCQTDSISIDIRESLSSEEFEHHFKDHAPDCAWIIQGDHCIDLLTVKFVENSKNSESSETHHE